MCEVSQQTIWLIITSHIDINLLFSQAFNEKQTNDKNFVKGLIVNIFHRQSLISRKNGKLARIILILVTFQRPKKTKGKDAFIAVKKSSLDLYKTRPYKSSTQCTS